MRILKKQSKNGPSNVLSKKDLLKKVLADPGVIISIGNIFLFSHVSALSFVVIFAAFLLILFSKAVSFLHETGKLGNPPYWMHYFIRKRYIGLEIMGYVCLFLSLLSIVHEDICGVVCGFCFGFANLLLAYRFEQNISSKLVWSSGKNLFSESKKSSPSFLCIVILLIQEPVVLASIGLINSGLSAGGESLFALPAMLAAPFLILMRPAQSRFLPQILLALGCAWYAIVGLINGHMLSSCANACFAAGLFLIGWHEKHLD